MRSFVNLNVFFVFALFFCLNKADATSLTLVSGDSTICLELSGKVTALNNDDENHVVKIELIYYNKVVDSLFVKSGKKFKMYLTKNAYYTLKISKVGYIEKIITVCTELKKFDPNEDFYKFYFDTELIPAIANEILNQDALEFPIAIIAFDEKLGGFFINEHYTTNIKRQSFNK